MGKGEGPDDWNKCEPWGEKERGGEEVHYLKSSKENTQIGMCLNRDGQIVFFWKTLFCQMMFSNWTGSEV